MALRKFYGMEILVYMKTRSDNQIKGNPQMHYLIRSCAHIYDIRAVSFPPRSTMLESYSFIENSMLNFHVLCCIRAYFISTCVSSSICASHSWNLFNFQESVNILEPTKITMHTFVTNLFFFLDTMKPYLWKVYFVDLG